MNSKTVIVLGSPRSGTSVTAGILHMLGVDMGNIRSPDPLNPRGYFEDWDFLKLGDRAFTACRSDSNGFSPPDMSEAEGVFGEFSDEASVLLENREKAARGQAWGWKTTHTCFLLNLYLPLLAQQPHVVVVLRNPLATADSISRYVSHEVKRGMYQPKSKIDSLQVVLEYEAALLHSVRASGLQNILYVAYEDLVKNPAAGIEELVSYISLNPNKKERKDALALVSRKRQRLLRKWLVPHFARSG